MPTTSAEENKAIVRRVIEELWNKGNLAVIDELYAADFVRDDPATPGVPGGPDSEKQVATMYRSAFPDLRLTIEGMIAEGDQVALRWTSTGTHRGDLQGLAPTGKSIQTSGITILRFANGKVVEECARWDTLGLMQQLGAIPG